MKEEQEFYICKHCGNIIAMIKKSGVPVVCCGENMTKLVPNTTDGTFEKHVPIVNVDGSIVDVNVGSVDHPMTAEHQIEWIYIQTSKGGQRKKLNVGDAPHADFIMTDGEELISVYEYCNLHGLWKTDL